MVSVRLTETKFIYTMYTTFPSCKLYDKLTESKFIYTMYAMFPSCKLYDGIHDGIHDGIQAHIYDVPSVIGAVATLNLYVGILYATVIG